MGASEALSRVLGRSSSPGEAVTHRGRHPEHAGLQQLDPDPAARLLVADRHRHVAGDGSPQQRVQQAVTPLEADEVDLRAGVGPAALAVGGGGCAYAPRPPRRPHPPLQLLHAPPLFPQPLLLQVAQEDLGTRGHRGEVGVERHLPGAAADANALAQLVLLAAQQGVGSPSEPVGRGG